MCMYIILHCTHVHYMYVHVYQCSCVDLACVYMYMYIMYLIVHIIYMYCVDLVCIYMYMYYFQSDLLVLTCDLLSNIALHELWDLHITHQSSITMLLVRPDHTQQDDPMKKLSIQSTGMDLRLLNIVITIHIIFRTGSDRFNNIWTSCVSFCFSRCRGWT